MRLRTGLFAIVLGLAVAGASETSSAAQGTGPDVRPVAATRALRRTVAAGTTAFALDVYRHLRAEPGNLVFSPFSLATAMAMASEGAAGPTRDQILSALRLRRDRRRVETGFQSVLASTRPDPASGVEFDVANRVWLPHDIPIRRSFVASLRRHFGAQVGELAGDPEAARRQINDWGSKATRGFIQEALPPGSSLANMALVNACYFAGKWQTPFPETQDDWFQLADHTWVPTPLMHLEQNLPWTEGPGFEVAELSYRGGEFAMMVVLPDRGRTLAQVESALTPRTLAAAVRSLGESNLIFDFPPFTVASQVGLNPALRSMGIRRAFDDRRADFSRMVTADHHAWIDDVSQSASIRVDAEGTVAAAVTVVSMGLGAQGIHDTPHRFRVDRPFLFLIRHRATGTILFMGRVEDPTK